MALISYKLTLISYKQLINKYIQSYKNKQKNIKELKKYVSLHQYLSILL